MTISEQQTRVPAGARPRRQSSRPNGQWKVDGRAPLNPTEVWKQESEPLEVRERIENIYAKQGFDSIESTDLHGRFRWWGLYTQRRPGIDGGRTATLEPHELEDRYFMLRIRVDGGQLSTEQLRAIASISTDFGRDTADITDRQNIQLHWIGIENVPEIWRRLESVGLRTTEACGDVPRVMLGSPVAGIAADELIDPTPILADITGRFLGDHSLANLPRKFKTAISGHPSHDVVHELNDVSFVVVEHPELGVGFDLWVGGGLSATPRLGERIGAFVPPERVPEVWHGVAQIFRDYGYRRLRNKARLKFLLADWGTERFREVLETEYLESPLPDGPAPARSSGAGDHVGVHKQKDGKYFIGVTPFVGRMSGTAFSALADLLERHGSQRLRTTPHQKILVLDIEEDDVEQVVRELDELGLSARPELFRRGTIACTGIQFCKLAIVETKDTATAAVLELERRLKGIELPAPISLHVNGCPNSCARVQTADIGLKGQLITDADGNQVPGFQVHLGGGVASTDRESAGMGRTVRGLKIPADGIPDYVERVVRRFVADRLGDETFAEWANRVDEDALQ